MADNAVLSAGQDPLPCICWASVSRASMSRSVSISGASFIGSVPDGPARPAVVSRVLLDLITVLAQYIWHPLNWAPVRLSLLAKSFDSEFQGEGTGGLPAVHDHDAGRPGSRRKGRTAP